MKGFDTNKYSPSVILLENYNHDPSYDKYMNKIGYELDKKLDYNYIYKKMKNHMNEFKMSYDDIENRIYINSYGINHSVVVRIYGDDKVIYTTNYDMDAFEYWFQPDEKLDRYKRIKVDVSNKDGIIGYDDNVGKRYYGQHHEDETISKYFPEGYIGGCIDVGATDGKNINNTRYFEQNGWYCLCIEPNPAYYHQCEANRKNTLMYAISDINDDNVDFNVVSIDGNEEAGTSLRVDDRLIEDCKKIGDVQTRVIKTNVRTLDYCIDNHYKFDKIDFVSIDTEGTELDVLKGFDIIKWQPKLFIIENNYNDNKMEEYLEKFGYKKDQRKDINDFYVKKENEIETMETFGNLVDKLTIVNLKIWKFEDIKRESTDDKEIADATRKTNVLNQQRNDLIQEIDEMLIDASAGKISFKNYKQGDTKSYGK